MITVWGIWMDGEWLGCGEPRVFSAREDAHYLAESLAEGDPDAFRDCEARLYGQFIQAPPPEVVGAVKAIGGGPVVVMQPHQESVHRILNWIAQAVGSES